ncbi:DUF6542 domain-containing protein [Nocardioides bruguierae]|uniref:DUF6542 domain-containing protein n=1 Tax=Nocardioides bruguierae TaxID=2945102 RepID=A0A9X2IG61_9ACTN|nr:DUF6542 domain-containing protein [Nocardioides bruguierae]MCL8025776.1 hypothetical protein [Nocardioides bruguierae]MCM0622042.1 hypothetical protein [Nocardioides bruguierae]
MTARTVWEEGREPGWQVAALATAATGSALALDLWWGADVGWLFDTVFVLACIAMALLVRPGDFFVVGSAPPWLMVGLMVVTALIDPAFLAEADDRAVQAVVAGMSMHAFPLVLGYALALAVLYVRDRVRKSHTHPRPHPTAS